MGGWVGGWVVNGTGVEVLEDVLLVHVAALHLFYRCVNEWVGEWMNGLIERWVGGWVRTYLTG